MDALAAGEKILSAENLSDKQLIVIDEIGPLELKNLGWSRAIDNICKTINLPQLWVVRKSIVSVVLKKWNVGKAFIYDIETDNEPDVLHKLNELIIKGTY